MKNFKKIPNNRSYKDILDHYLVEKSIAEKLKTSTRDERIQLYSNMYQELFSKVKDHPRLTQKENKELEFKLICDKLSLINKYLNNDVVFLEFAPGDCSLSFKVADFVRKVYAVDIYNQIPKNRPLPKNFELIIYDGFNLTQLDRDFVDIVFSDQFVEHLHPDDVAYHFELAFRLLKKGGVYIFRTPHVINGPHDVSGYFSEVAEGFHLKEWTYSEIQEVVKKAGFQQFISFWHAKKTNIFIPFKCFVCIEKILSILPSKFKKIISNYFIPSICVLAIKK